MIVIVTVIVTELPCCDADCGLLSIVITPCKRAPGFEIPVVNDRDQVQDQEQDQEVMVPPAASWFLIKFILKQNVLMQLQVYKKSGLLGPRTILAHCVHLTDEEVEVITQNDSMHQQ